MPTLRTTLRRGCLALALGLMSGGMLGCGPAATPPSTSPATSPANILFIVIDTLRWDHLGVQAAPPREGTARERTPALDAFASSAIRFDRAYASAPWTRPSIGSMMTGLHPSAHGGTAVDRPLPEQALTLAEILSAGGYATRAVVSNWVIARKNGFAQGFDVYDEWIAALHQKSTSERVSQAAVKKLEDLAAGERPYFLFVHYFDPHYRYLPHPEVGWAKGEVGRLAEHPSVFELRDLGKDLSEAELRNLRDLYAEEVRSTDDQVRVLLQELDRLDPERETIVVVVSDHGEEIFERGYLGHAHSLYEELLRVPFMIRAPGLGAGVVEAPVSLVSLTPTLLELTGFDTEAFDFHGASLAPLMRGGAPDPAPLLFAEVDYLPDKRVERTARKRSLTGERFKLIRDQVTGDLELYDLKVDPGERQNLARQRQDLVDTLLPILIERTRRAEAASPDASVRTLDDEERKMLENLGYLEPED